MKTLQEILKYTQGLKDKQEAKIADCNKNIYATWMKETILYVGIANNINIKNTIAIITNLLFFIIFFSCKRTILYIITDFCTFFKY